MSRELCEEDEEGLLEEDDAWECEEEGDMERQETPFFEYGQILCVLLANITRGVVLVEGVVLCRIVFSWRMRPMRIGRVRFVVLPCVVTNELQDGGERLEA